MIGQPQPQRLRVVAGVVIWCRLSANVRLRHGQRITHDGGRRAKAGRRLGGWRRAKLAALRDRTGHGSTLLFSLCALIVLNMTRMGDACQRSAPDVLLSASGLALCPGRLWTISALLRNNRRTDQPQHGERSPAVKMIFRWKDENSNIGGCPAQYKVTSAEGGYVIQGKRLSAEPRTQLRDLAPDEDAVWVPDNVIDRNR